MAQSTSMRAKIPTESPQQFRKGAARAAGRPKTASSPSVLAGTGHAAARGGGEVIDLECGITVYPPGPRAAAGAQSGTKTASGSSARGD